MNESSQYHKFVSVVKLRVPEKPLSIGLLLSVFVALRLDRIICLRSIYSSTLYFS